MKQIFNISLITLIAVLLFSCGKDESTDPKDAPKFLYNYFPVQVGTFIEYDVNEVDVEVTVHRYDTSFYHIREVLDSTFLDNEGRLTQKIMRYRKNTNEAEWKIQDVWYSNRTKTTAERSEENVRYLKLIFPAEVDDSWNGNVYNSVDDDFISELTSEISSMNNSETVGKLKYDSVLTVLQTDKATLLGSRKVTEKYATKVGLVYKKYTEIAFKATTSVPPQYNVDVHKEIEMTAVKSGVD